MTITHVVFDRSTFGITANSLKMLRNALAEKVTHRIAVYEVPTDELCCGYMILDYEWSNATWTGDGFRTDREGEGGAGYKSAEALFSIYRITPVPWGWFRFKTNFALSHYEDKETEEFLHDLAQEMADDAEVCNSFVRPFDQVPYYVRG